jgi:hypothetical protein
MPQPGSVWINYDVGVEDQIMAEHEVWLATLPQLQAAVRSVTTDGGKPGERAFDPDFVDHLDTTGILFHRGRKP